MVLINTVTDRLKRTDDWKCRQKERNPCSSCPRIHLTLPDFLLLPTVRPVRYLRSYLVVKTCHSRLYMIAKCTLITSFLRCYIVNPAPCANFLDKDGRDIGRITPDSASSFLA